MSIKCQNYVKILNFLIFFLCLSYYKKRLNIFLFELFETSHFWFDCFQTNHLWFDYFETNHFWLYWFQKNHFWFNRYL